MAKLSYEEMMKLKYALASRWKTAHDRFKKVKDMVNGEWHPLNLETRTAGRVHEVIPATAKTMVEGVTSHVKPKSFSVKFKPLRPTERAREQADGLEDAGHEFLERHGLAKASSPLTEVAKNTAMYGLSFMRTLFQPQKWGVRPVKEAGESGEDFDYREALWEAQRSIELPFQTDAIDPLNVLPGPGKRIPDYLFETYEIQPFALQSQFPLLQDPNPFATKQFTAFWSPEQWQYFVGSAPIMIHGRSDAENSTQGLTSWFDPRLNETKALRPTDDNFYGIVPYTTVWSGLGKRSPDGKPEEEAVGLIWPLMSLLKEEARSLTAISIIMQVSAQPRFLTRGAPRGKLNIGMAPGDATEIGQTMIEPFPEIRVPPDLYSIQTIISQQMEMMLGAKLLTGMRPAGVTSALFEEILLEQAEQRYKTFIESLEDAYSMVLAQMLFIWENIVREKVPGIKIDPKKIRGHYRGTIKFEYSDIAKERIQTMIAKMLFQAGLYDFEKAHDFMGTENISDVRRGLIKDQLYNDPNMIAAIGLKLLEESGLDKVYEKAMRRMQGAPAQLSALTPSPAEEGALTKMLTKGIEEGVRPEGFAGGGIGGATEGVGVGEGLGV